MLLTLALLAAAPVQTQLELNRSAAHGLVQADATMTAEWQRTYAAMKRLDAANRSRGGGFGHAAATLESQRAWLRFRDTQCTAESGMYAGGSMQGMVAAQCKTRLTNERTVQLREMRRR